MRSNKRWKGINGTSPRECTLFSQVFVSGFLEQDLLLHSCSHNLVSTWMVPFRQCMPVKLMAVSLSAIYSANSGMKVKCTPCAFPVHIPNTEMIWQPRCRLCKLSYQSQKTVPEPAVGFHLCNSNSAKGTEFCNVFEGLSLQVKLRLFHW